MTMPVALTIAGSDSGGGAGIQADLKSFAANGCYGASAVAALTAQNTMGVGAVHTVPPRFLEQQIESVLSDLPVAAIKIGMLGTAGNISVVADALDRYRGIPVVLDPVLVSTSGRMLLDPDALDLFRERLIPKADLLTPNLPELATLLKTDCLPAAPDLPGLREQLMALGAAQILVKGGHGGGEVLTDCLVGSGEPVCFTAKRQLTDNLHGTGCTLSSAIAAHLARGAGMLAAVRQAHDYLQRAIAAAADQKLGAGPGPVEHFFALDGGLRDD